MTGTRNPVRPTADDREHVAAVVRPAGARRRTLDPFVVWGAGATIAWTVVAVVLGLARNDGHLVYVIDDPAIHLSMADTLVQHGTWGVVEGVYESASSSPGWTLLLAATAGLAPRFDEWFPLLLNLAAAVALLAALGRAQTFLRPGLARPLDGMVVAAIALAVLFLPGLAATGMEHTLHAALVVVAVDQFTRLRGPDPRRRDLWLGYLALAAASLFRFETLFVAAGLGVALLLDCIPRLSLDGRGRPLVPQLLKGAGCGVVAGAPVLVVGAVNLAMGQSFWPNSIVSKTAVTDDAGPNLARLRSPYELIRTVTTEDVVVLALVAFALVVLVWAWYGGPRRQVLAATAFLATVLLHTLLAKYGWFERYQAYLIALGVLVLLGWASEVVRPAGRRPVLVAALVVILVVAPFKIRMLTSIPLGMSNTYSQRYHAAEFFDRYYDGRAVATSELGYISLAHDGPVIDVLGLGSHEVIVAREQHVDDADYWQRLMDENEVEVVAMYPAIFPRDDVPEEWELVAQWRLHGDRVTGPYNRFEFWAPGAEFVEPLMRNLDEYASELPENVETLCITCLTKLAEAQADADG